MLVSQLSDDDKQVVIDVAMYDQIKFGKWPSHLDYKSADAELLIDRFLIISQTNKADFTRKIVSKTIPAENFKQEGHTDLKLSDGIYHLYLKLYKDDKQRAL